MQGYDAVGSSVRVYWSNDMAWYEGLVDEYHPDSGYHVQYYDGDDEWLADLEHDVQIVKNASRGGSVTGGGSKLGGSRSLLSTSDFDFFDMDQELDIIPKKEEAPKRVMPKLEEPKLDASKPATSSSIPKPRPQSASGSSDHQKHVSIAEIEKKTPPPMPVYEETKEINSPMRRGSQIEEDEEEPQTIEQYQEHNRDIVNSQVTFLHPRGVLLVGSVLNAAISTSNEYDTNDAGVSFRVLFVEGGSQPAMFRCKTPVFTSPVVDNRDDHPVWTENTFRFDMIMPEETSTAKFNIYGDVLISVYRSRPTGGNDLVGQATFDLHKISKTGTVEYFQEGIEGRSATGRYSIMQGNAVTGEIEVQLNIAWKSRPGEGAEEEEEGIMPKKDMKVKQAASVVGSKTATKSRPGSAAATRPASTGRLVRPKSAAPNGGTVAGTTTPAKYIPPPPRKIVSNIAKKQRDDALRIEKENKALQSRLQKHTQVGGMAYNAQDAKTVISQLHNNTKHLEAYAAEAKETTRMVEERTKKSSKQTPSSGTGKGPLTGPAAEAKDAETMIKLNNLYNTLKKTLADEEVEVKNLKAKLNNLNIHIKKYSSGIERIKSRGGHHQAKDSSDAKSTSGGLRSSGTNNLRRSTGGNSVALGEESAQPKEDTLGNTNSDSKETPLYIENNYDSKDITDGEYISVKDEYDTLQRIRRGLIERVKSAKKLCGDVGTKTNVVENKVRTMKNRLLQLTDDYSSFFSDEDLKSEAKSWEPSSTDHDSMLFSRNLALQDELVALELSMIENPEIMQIISARAELKSVVDILRGKSEKLQKEVDELNAEKVQLMSDLKIALESDSLFKLRDFISQMRAMELRMLSTERQTKITEGVKSAEMHLLRLKIKAKEREVTRSTPDTLLT